MIGFCACAFRDLKQQRPRTRSETLKSTQLRLTAGLPEYLFHVGPRSLIPNASKSSREGPTAGTRKTNDEHSAGVQASLTENGAGNTTVTFRPIWEELESEHAR